MRLNRKWGTFFLLLCLLPLVAACATVQQVDPNYALYVSQVKPLLDLKLHPDGKIAGIQMNQPPQPYVQKQNEWARVVEKLIGAAGIFGAIWAGGQALSDLADNVGKNAGTVVTNSGGAYVGNQAGNQATYGSPPTNYADSFNQTPAPAEAPAQ